MPMSLRMLSTYFFHIDCAVTLQRLYCLLVIEVGSRYVDVLGDDWLYLGRAVDHPSRSVLS